MDTCPPELHSYICRLACFDDGTTVRALNLVSRYFHEISRPFLYQSISLYSHDQVDELVSKLQLYLFTYVKFDTYTSPTGLDTRTKLRMSRLKQKYSAFSPLLRRRSRHSRLWPRAHRRALPSSGSSFEHPFRTYRSSVCRASTHSFLLQESCPPSGACISPETATPTGFSSWAV
ncbi:hypothetical protein BD779DRAFT_465024 [Infundibulicybe gibba]|nr:hypothetical protein BD779DRAFT_465024 [Infundibulicybe gibba]